MEGSQIIGMVSVMKEDYYPWVSTLFVPEAYRGFRVSEKLIACANDYLKKQGFSTSYIPSGHVGLYERYGYSHVRDITNYGGAVDHRYAKDLR